MDPDPWGPKTCGFGSGTLPPSYCFIVCFQYSSSSTRINMIQILPIPNNSIHFKLTFWENTFSSRKLNLSHVSEKIPSLPGKRLEKGRHVLPRRLDPVHLGPDPDPRIRYPESWNLIRILSSNFLNTVLSVLVWKWEDQNLFRTPKDLDR